MQPEIQIGSVDNIYSRMMYFKSKGDTEIGHMHQFDHLTLLAKGSLRVTVEGVPTDFTAPHMIYIHADKIHELVALTDETIAYCIHALRDNEGCIIDTSMIPKGTDVRKIAAPLCK